MMTSRNTAESGAEVGWNCTFDLVGKGVHQRSMDGKERIEEVGELDAVRLGDEPEEGSVSVEAPGLALGDDVDCRLAVPIEKLVAELPGGVLVGNFDRDG